MTTSNLTIKYQAVLHKSLDALVADFIYQTNKLPSETSVAELLEWSSSRLQKHSPTKRALDGGDSAAFLELFSPQVDSAPKYYPRPPRRK